MLLKLTEVKGDIDSRIRSFVLQYRQAPVHYGKSPASLRCMFTPRMPFNIIAPGTPLSYHEFGKNLSNIFEPGITISTEGKSCVNTYNPDSEKSITRHLDQTKPMISSPSSPVIDN